MPFVIARIFRPTFLDVFQLNNFELGTLYSTYGVVALLSYVYGGTLADRCPPGKLMATALIMTAAGGMYLAQFPSYQGLQWLYGYWGFSTIFFFWSAMIKATRNWGGGKQQGRAFGYLEAGRGLMAASIGVVGVLVFSFLLPDDLKAASFEERKAAFRYVILFAVALSSLVGLFVFFFLKEQETQEEISIPKTKNSLNTIIQVAKIPSVGLLIIIVLCAYCGYKVTDILSLYAAEVMLFDEVDAAKVGSYQMYLRPLVCVLVGIFADKSSSALWLIRGFIVLLIGSLLLASGWVNAPLSGLFIFAVVITGIGTYALRTLYYAAVKEGRIPYAITGTAVGIISVVGYTPDIFMGPVMGVLLDSSPGVTGHQHVFTLLAAFSLIGALAAYRFKKMTQRDLIAK